MYLQRGRGTAERSVPIAPPSGRSAESSTILPNASQVPRAGRMRRAVFRMELQMKIAGRIAAAWCATATAALLPAAHAQTRPELERCSAIADASARLACFDAAVAAAARGPADAATPPPAAMPPRTESAGPAQARAEEPRPAGGLRATGTLEGGQSLIAQRWELEDRYKRGLFAFTFYRPNYILPVVWSNNVNDAPRTPTQPAPVLPGTLDETEAEFQLSFKLKMWEGILGGNSDLWLGYTQKSSWQVYNEALSRPFRETNYEPELIWSIPTDYSILGMRGRLLALGLVHQSNGRGDPLSRSWNRAYVMAALERGPFVLQIKPWVRISEDEADDDNPDIVDYMGRAEFLAFYKWREQYTAALRLRTTFKSEPSWGSAQLDLRFPIVSDLRGYLQVFSGYGESMIDYNFRKTSIGLGISIGTWY
jgi:phospholipase A1/A2